MSTNNEKFYVPQGITFGDSTIQTSAYANTNVASYLPTYTGNLVSLTGNITTSGNISGNFIIGDGSQLTNLPAGNYSNANVANYMPVYSGKIGNGSNIISGSGATAGSFSVALGQTANASGSLSTSIGASTKSIGSQSVAIGYTTTATSGSDIAIGSFATSNGGVALGSSANATGSSPVALGDSALANGLGVISVGSLANASGTQTLAVGYGSQASGFYSVAIGPHAQATANGAIILNATGVNTPTPTNGFFVNSPRNLTGSTTNVVFYNSSTKEFTYGNAPAPTPAGSNTQIQFNNAGALGASANLIWDGSSLSVTGNIIAGNFIGNGSTLSSITGSNVTGTVANATSATTAGTVTTNAQPNITSVGTLTSLTISGAITVNSGNNATAINNGGSNGVGNIGSSSTYFDTIFAKATSAQYADLAEMYVADKLYDHGTVVVIGGEFEITASNTNHDSSVVGIISQQPSYLMNSTQEGEYVLPVALTGRVQCKVIGPIKKGECVVTSDEVGAAMSLNNDLFKPGCVVGKSLVDFPSDEIGFIEVLVGKH